MPLDVLHGHGAGWEGTSRISVRYLAGDESTWKARWQELAPRTSQ